jgi:hypothetical protein
MFTHYKNAAKSAQTVLAQQSDSNANVNPSSSFSDRLAQLVKVYGQIKPLLTALATFRFVPANWRNAIAILSAALEAVVAGAGSVGADFKAGKDL